MCTADRWITERRRRFATSRSSSIVVCLNDITSIIRPKGSGLEVRRCQGIEGNKVKRVRYTIYLVPGMYVSYRVEFGSNDAVYRFTMYGRLSDYAYMKAPTVVESPNS